MKSSFPFVTFIAVLLLFALQAQAHAIPAGPLMKHLSSLLKWTRSSSKAPPSDGNVLQFENGYLVETVVEGNEIGVLPYKIHVSKDGELFAVDSVNSNIVKITPPLSKYSRARLVAGSFQSHNGHVDGKPNDARFNHPKGVTMDDKGNVYVADTLNLAIRKIGDAGVTTIAGGKSNVAGYRDGPSEDAKFSNDFDIIYVQSTCSLLVIDRGNAAIRQISLNDEDCEYQDSSISNSDVLMVIGAVLVGYVTYFLQQGFGTSYMSHTYSPSETEFKQKPSKEEPMPIMDNSTKEEPGWPSFGQLVIDLSKLAIEALGSIFLSVVPARLRNRRPKKGLTPLKDSLKMPEDEPKPLPVHRQRTPTQMMETRQAHVANSIDNFSETKPPKIKSTSFKDSSLQSKHRSSKRQEYADFYGSGEIPPPYSRSKSQKERPRHRQREKSGEVSYGAVGSEMKPVEMKPVDYDNSKYEHYNTRNKYGSNAPFGF